MAGKSRGFAKKSWGLEEAENTQVSLDLEPWKGARCRRRNGCRKQHSPAGMPRPWLPVGRIITLSMSGNGVAQCLRNAGGPEDRSEDAGSGGREE